MTVMGTTGLSRREKVAVARELREEGLLLREIAERLGVAKQTVHAWLTDPDGSRLRARKDSYRGICQECGGPTNGSRGPGRAPKTCLTCLTWSEEAILEALRAFAAVHGRSPRCCDTRDTEGLLPNAKAVVRRFGSWNAGLVAAGLTINQDRFPETQAEVERLVLEGVPVADIAARFGWTIRAVERRFEVRGTSISEFRAAASSTQTSEGGRDDD